MSNLIRMSDKQLERMNRWDFMFDERHRVEDAAMVRTATDEIRELRALRERLEDWAKELEAPRISDEHGGVGPFIAAELRARMAGGAQK